MAQTKNLCAQIPTALHAQVCEAREQSGLTTAQYITNLLIEYFEMKENGGTRTPRATFFSFGATSSGPPTWTVPCRSPVWSSRPEPCSPIWPRPGR